MSWVRGWCGGRGWAGRRGEEGARLEGAPLKSRARRAPQPSRWPKLGDLSALYPQLVDGCQEWEWGGRRGPVALASVHQQRLPRQADHCQRGQPGAVGWEGQNHPCLNPGGGLSAGDAWSVMPGSTEGDFQPIWIHLVHMNLIHLKQNLVKDKTYSKMKKDLPQTLRIAFSSIFEHFHLGKIGQVWFNFQSSLSRYFFLLLSITLHDSLMPQPMMRTIPKIPFVVLWCSNPWAYSKSITTETNKT